MNREFSDNDREIKTQIVQNCLSHKLRLRMKALQNPELTLTQLLDAGKSMEMSKSQAETIEEKQNINKLSTKYTRRASKQNKSCRGCGNQNHYEAVCRSKKPNKKQEFKTQKPRHNVQNLVDENSSSED
jgi:hypothetical protein